MGPRSLAPTGGHRQGRHGDPVLAEDVLQDCLVDIFRRWDGIRGEGSNPLATAGADTRSEPPVCVGGSQLTVTRPSPATTWMSVGAPGGALWSLLPSAVATDAPGSAKSQGSQMRDSVIRGGSHPPRRCPSRTRGHGKARCACSEQPPRAPRMAWLALLRPGFPTYPRAIT